MWDGQAAGRTSGREQTPLSEIYMKAAAGWANRLLHDTDTAGPSRFSSLALYRGGVRSTVSSRAGEIAP